VLDKPAQPSLLEDPPIFIINKDASIDGRVGALAADGIKLPGKS
jgi:hypothetical protein